MLVNIEDLFKTSQKILSHNDIKNASDTKINRYANIAKVGDNGYLLEFVAKDNGEVSLYSVDMLNKEAVPANVSVNKTSTPGTATVSIADIQKIFKSKLVKKYNNDYKNRIDTDFNPQIRFQKDDAIGLSSFGKSKSEIEGENFGIRDVINNIKQGFDDYKSFKRAIDEGRTVKELCETEGIFKLFEEDLKDFGDYVITAMPENMAKQRTYGRHFGKQKAIMLNMEAIGNDVNKFTEVLMHEFEHAKQKAEFDRLEKKGNLTHKELQKVVNYKRNAEVNKKRQAYYNKNEKVLAPIIDELYKLSTKAEKDFFINSLNHEEKRIYNEYRKLYNDYRNSPNEISARKAGTRAAERVKNVKTRMDASGRELVEIRQERDVRTRPRSSVGEYEEAQRRRSEAERSGGEFEASEEFIDSLDEYTAPVKSTKDAIGLSSIRKEPDKQTNKKINSNAVSKTKDKLYKWHGNIQKDRFDLNRSLQAFVNATKVRAVELSKQKGFKITDKQLREIMPFLRERTELPENLGREDLTKIWNGAKEKRH